MCNSVLFFLFGFALCAQGPDTTAEIADTAFLKGSWELSKCEIVKDSAGIISTVEYKPDKEREYHKWFIFPKLTFGEGKSCFVETYDNKYDGSYSLPTDGGGIVMDFTTFITVYEYRRENSVLRLTRRHRDFIPEEIVLDLELYYSKK